MATSDGSTRYYYVKVLSNGKTKRINKAEYDKHTRRTYKGGEDEKYTEQNPAPFGYYIEKTDYGIKYNPSISYIIYDDQGKRVKLKSIHGSVEYFKYDYDTRLDAVVTIENIINKKLRENVTAWRDVGQGRWEPLT